MQYRDSQLTGNSKGAQHAHQSGNWPGTLSTDEASGALGVKSQTLRKRLSQTGSYFGIRPVKLPSGKLRWPIDAVENMLKGGAE